MTKPVLVAAIAVALVIPTRADGPRAQRNPATAFVNGRWYAGGRFVPGTRYVANGRLTLSRPGRLERTVDLGDRYVLPPLGDAHQHAFTDPATLADETKRFMKAGVFYVMVQDSMGAVPAAVLKAVNTPESVDVVYTRAPIIAPRHGMVDFFVRLGREGRFGGRQTEAELDGTAFFAVDRPEELATRWPAIEHANPDLLKVILAYSEDHARRRADPRYYSDETLSMARPGVDPALLPDIVRRAHASRRRVSVHIETAADFRTAVRAGADMIAHFPGWRIGRGTGYDVASLARWKIEAADAAEAARRRTVIVTTTYPKPFLDNATLGPAFADIHHHNMQLLLRAGASIALGADNSEVTVVDEARHLLKIGAADTPTLVTLLTRTPRAVFPNRPVGTLDEGAEASFIVLDRDPLVDLENLTTITFRVKHGKLLDAAPPAPQEPVVVFEATRVAGPIHFFRAKGQPVFDNVIASIGPDGTLLVDTAYPSSVGPLRDALRNAGSGPVRIVVNTHYHHAGANEAFGREAIILAHEHVRARMQQATKMYGAMPIGPWAPSALPAITLRDETTLHFNGEEIRVRHFPNAHTDGDVIVWFTQSNAIATGDLYVPLLGPCDLANGCNWNRYEAAISHLLRIVPKDATLLPGHGPAATYRDLEEFAAMLTEVTAAVRADVAAGRSLDEVTKKGLPARWKSWASRGISDEFFLTNVYQGVANR